MPVRSLPDLQNVILQPPSITARRSTSISRSTFFRVRLEDRMVLCRDFTMGCVICAPREARLLAPELDVAAVGTEGLLTLLAA